MPTMGYGVDFPLISECRLLFRQFLALQLLWDRLEAELLEVWLFWGLPWLAPLLINCIVYEIRLSRLKSLWKSAPSYVPFARKPAFLDWDSLFYRNYAGIDSEWKKWFTGRIEDLRKSHHFHLIRGREITHWLSGMAPLLSHPKEISLGKLIHLRTIESWPSSW